MEKQKEPPKTCSECRNHIKVEFGRLECLLAEHYLKGKDATVRKNEKACKYAK